MKIEISDHTVDEFGATTVLVSDLQERDDQTIANIQIQERIDQLLREFQANGEPPSIYIEFRRCKRKKFKLVLETADVEAVVLSRSRFDVLEVSAEGAHKMLLAVSDSYLGKYRGSGGGVELAEGARLGRHALVDATYSSIASEIPILRLGWWAASYVVTDPVRASLRSTLFRTKLQLILDGRKPQAHL